MRLVAILTFIACLTHSARSEYVEEEEACKCVPINRCSKKVEIIDIRNTSGGCSHYLDTCCTKTKTLPSLVTQRSGVPAKPKQTSKTPGNWRVESRAKPPPPSRIRHGCGQRNPQGATDFRIVNTVDGTTQFAEWPWMVAVVSMQEDVVTNKTDRMLYQCGGSLIHNQVVLTAAHCVKSFVNQPRQLKVLLGEWDTQTDNEGLPVQEIKVRSIILHEQFDAGTLFNDLALLVLHRSAKVADNVDTVCLPRQSWRPQPGTKCFATGWGKDKFGMDGLYQVILKSIELPIVTHTDCQEALRTTRLSKFFKLHDSFLCAGGEPGIDTCKGDGGGPLVCPVAGQEGHFEQVGVVSWGIGCGEAGVPGVYADVGRVRSWVDGKMAELNFTTGSYSWPDDAYEADIDIRGNEGFDVPVNEAETTLD